MNLHDFYYDLPEELIAQDPLADRSSSRLMVLDRQNRSIEHKHFTDVIDYLEPGDCLVLNNTKVIPARLFGVKIVSNSGKKLSGKDIAGEVEVLLLKRMEGAGRADDAPADAGMLPPSSMATYSEDSPDGDSNESLKAATGSLHQRCRADWECLVRPGKKCRPGSVISFGDGLLTGEILDYGEDGNRHIRFTYDGIFEEILDKLGQMPLPPYIKHKLKDKNRYQTVYAKYDGSAAAPTAGLHFTPELLKEIEKRGVRIAYVTLHVGLGTFRPVKTENILEHHMHSEYYNIPEEAADIINETKAAGKRVICVGTTSCRTIESAADEKGHIGASSGWTDIFIYPVYKFKVLDALITNFHLPESTLLMLVSALAGREFILDAYKCAVEEKYRFFSFGDAMIIL